METNFNKIKKTMGFRRAGKVLRGILGAVAGGIAVVMLALLLSGLAIKGPASAAGPESAGDQGLMDRFDMFMTNTRSDALDGVLEVKKVYWLKDEDVAAPEPDPTKFGRTTDPKSLQWLVDEARELLDGQELLFNTDIEIMPGTDIQYYIDETIVSITWKQIIDFACYNFNEVKIAHPSQFRRFLADGQYGSERQYTNTQMSAVVNAVSSSNGDFYKYRNLGIVVYNGQVYRSENTPDVCFIDEAGEMILVQDRTFKTQQELEAFVQENKIRFSLSFGPILVENYQVALPYVYELGEIHDRYARAALADMGDLHYLIVVNSFEGGYDLMPNLFTFANVVQSFGCEKAYTLDGGQTAVIVMNDQMVSTPSYGNQRYVSDMIYFATAIPGKEGE